MAVLFPATMYPLYPVTTPVPRNSTELLGGVWVYNDFELSVVQDGASNKIGVTVRIIKGMRFSDIILSLTRAINQRAATLSPRIRILPVGKERILSLDTFLGSVRKDPDLDARYFSKYLSGPFIIRNTLFSPKAKECLGEEFIGKYERLYHECNVIGDGLSEGFSPTSFQKDYITMLEKMLEEARAELKLTYDVAQQKLASNSMTDLDKERQKEIMTYLNGLMWGSRFLSNCLNPRFVFPVNINRTVINADGTFIRLPDVDVVELPEKRRKITPLKYLQKSEIEKPLKLVPMRPLSAFELECDSEPFVLEERFTAAPPERRIVPLLPRVPALPPLPFIATTRPLPISVDKRLPARGLLLKYVE